MIEKETLFVNLHVVMDNYQKIKDYIDEMNMVRLEIVEMEAIAENEVSKVCNEISEVYDENQLYHLTQDEIDSNLALMEDQESQLTDRMMDTLSFESSQDKLFERLMDVLRDDLCCDWNDRVIYRIIEGLVDDKTALARIPLSENLINRILEVEKIYRTYMVDQTDGGTIVYHVDLQEEIKKYANKHGDDKRPYELVKWFESHPVVPYSRVEIRFSVHEDEIKKLKLYPAISKTMFDQCGNCGTEVEINTRGISQCPECGFEMKPCDMCVECMKELCPWGPFKIIEKGQYIRTPRFGEVEIKEVFENEMAADEAGYTETTHYENLYYHIRGKSIGINRMIFAAIKLYHDIAPAQEPVPMTIRELLETNDAYMKFAEAVYKKYQLMWMSSHGYSLDDIITEVAEEALRAEGVDLADEHSNDEYFVDARELNKAFQTWQYETGFGGSLWVCLDEFLEAEFKERSYIESFPGMIDMQMYDTIMGKLAR